MLSQEIILNISFSIYASIAFFFIYTKTRLNIMLLAGAITYFELLVRLFITPITPFMFFPNLDLLMIPEMLILIYMIVYIYNDGFPYITAMLILMTIAFIMLITIGHTFYGDLGIIFALILIIWVQQSNLRCKIDPWEECSGNGK
jgi:hypothetical protein